MKFEQAPQPPKRKKPGLKEKLAAGLIALSGAAGGAEPAIKHGVPDSGARSAAREKRRKDDPDFDQLSTEKPGEHQEETPTEV